MSLLSVVQVVSIVVTIVATHFVADFRGKGAGLKLARGIYEDTQTGRGDPQ